MPMGRKPPTYDRTKQKRLKRGFSGNQVPKADANSVGLHLNTVLTGFAAGLSLRSSRVMPGFKRKPALAAKKIRHQEFKRVAVMIACDSASA